MLTEKNVMDCVCNFQIGNFFAVDAWGKHDEGEVVAVIHTSGDVYEINVSACNSNIVKEVIKDKIKSLLQ